MKFAGDVVPDRVIDLREMIVILQMLSGAGQRMMSGRGDADPDGRIGISDAPYIPQVLGDHL